MEGHVKVACSEELLLVRANCFSYMNCVEQDCVCMVYLLAYIVNTLLRREVEPELCIRFVDGDFLALRATHCASTYEICGSLYF